MIPEYKILAQSDNGKQMDCFNSFIIEIATMLSCRNIVNCYCYCVFVFLCFVFNYTNMRRTIKTCETRAVLFENTMLNILQYQRANMQSIEFNIYTQFLFQVQKVVPLTNTKSLFIHGQGAVASQGFHFSLFICLSNVSTSIIWKR